MQRDNFPSVSIIIPCRNEEKHIERCLNSIIAQNYPKEKFEILIVDGMSKDRTREIVSRYLHASSTIKLLDNPKGIIPIAMNVGIQSSKSDIIIRVDAHTTYIEDFILKSVEYLIEYNADNIGGIWITKSGSNTLIAQSIALVLSHPFGVGNSYFRLGCKKPRLVDTVAFGCYWRKLFSKIGLFNENMVRSEDIELNMRIKKAGGKIYLMPKVMGCYYPKSNLKDFFLHNFQDGVWATYSLKFTKISLRIRHYIPLLFVVSLLGTGVVGFFLPVFRWLFLFIAGLYLLTSLYCAVQIATKKKSVQFLFTLPLVFAVRHIAYGMGSVWGFIKLLL